MTKFTTFKAFEYMTDEETFNAYVKEVRREARIDALEEAAKELDAWGDIYGRNAAAAIRALKDKQP